MTAAPWQEGMGMNPEKPWEMSPRQSMGPAMQIGPQADEEKKRKQLADLLMGGGQYGMGALGIGLSGGVEGLSPVAMLGKLFD